MILLIWFEVIDNSQNDDRDTHTKVDNDCTSSVHDDSGKPFVIVLSYKNCISFTRDHNSISKKDCRWSVYDDLCKSFMMLLSYRNCV